MADEMKSEPVGSEQHSETPLWQRRGFKSEADFEKTFDGYKTDISDLKTKVKSLDEKARKADEYEAIKRAEEESKMDELQKLSVKYKEIENLKLQLEQQLVSERKQAVFERAVSPRYAGAQTQEERNLLRRLYEAEALKGFEDEKDLGKRLDSIDADWAASRVGKETGKQPPIPGMAGAGLATGQQNPYDLGYFKDLENKASKPKTKVKG